MEQKIIRSPLLSRCASTMGLLKQRRETEPPHINVDGKKLSQSFGFHLVCDGITWNTRCASLSCWTSMTEWFFADWVPCTLCHVECNLKKEYCMRRGHCSDTYQTERMAFSNCQYFEEAKSIASLPSLPYSALAAGFKTLVVALVSEEETSCLEASLRGF